MDKDASKSFEADLTDLDRSEWDSRLRDVAEDYGYFQPLGDKHSAAFIDAGKTLIVTFESIASIRRASDLEEPRGFDFTRQLGWSSLSLISDGDTWFRDPNVYGYFDRLVDDGFFEDFDQVLFFGIHAGGYAACAFSVASPGARVLAFRPQATLDPSVTGWDHRYLEMRRTSFSDRYGYAPDMLDAANHAFVVHDPTDRMDAMQASLFTKSNVTQFRTPHLGWKLVQRLDEMGALTPMIIGAMDGTLDRDMFARLFRARKTNLAYLRAMMAYLEKEDRPLLTAWLCRYVLAGKERPLFLAKLEELQAMGVPVELPEKAQTAAE